MQLAEHISCALHNLKREAALCARESRAREEREILRRMTIARGVVFVCVVITHPIAEDCDYRKPGVVLTRTSFTNAH